MKIVILKMKWILVVSGIKLDFLYRTCLVILASSTLALDLITGYRYVADSKHCIILESEEDFSIAVLPFSLFQFSSNTGHSVEAGLNALKWIISPMNCQTFFSLVNSIFQIWSEVLGKYII